MSITSILPSKETCGKFVAIGTISGVVTYIASREIKFLIPVEGIIFTISCLAAQMLGRKLQSLIGQKNQFFGRINYLVLTYSIPVSITVFLGKANALGILILLGLNTISHEIYEGLRGQKATIELEIQGHRRGKSMTLPPNFSLSNGKAIS